MAQAKLQMETTMECRVETVPIRDNMQNGNTLAVGIARTGKTVFLRNMAAKLREAYPNALFVFIFPNFATTTKPGMFHSAFSSPLIFYLCTL